MAYRRRTLRRMSPTARKVARLAGETNSLARRLKNLIPELQLLDADSEALKTAKQATTESIRHAPSCCNLMYCFYNPVNPPEDSQECIACPNLKDPEWSPKPS